MNIEKFGDHYPQIEADVFVASSAKVIGRVKIGAGSSVWYGAVIRGDVADITIGQNTSIQDNCTVHVGIEVPTVIGNNVTVGHNAVIHSCTVEDNCLIGMGAIVLDGAKIGQGSIVGAGCVVPENKQIPPRSLVVGIPAKIIKTMDEDREQQLKKHAAAYMELAQEYK
ncbi:MAG: gamma carbonic anhydrase family protein [Bacillota bacterium]